MTETASLIIKVDSSGAAKATDNLKKLDRAAGNTERAANKLGKAWGAALGLISSAAIIGATRAYIQQADAFANMSAKIKLVTGSTEAATRAQKALFELSQRTSSDLAGTTELYVRLGQSSKELAADQGRLLGITELVSKSMIVSGASTSEAASSVRQFTQAVASGLLRGDEFNSIMENSPRLAKAMADGLGVPIGALRKMAEEGQLTAEKIISAVESQGAVIDREFGEMPLTVSRATQQVRNALQQLIGDTDQASGASADLAKSIESLARTLESDETKAAFASIVQGITSITGAIASAIPHIIEFNNKLSEGLGLTALPNGNRKGTAADVVAGLAGGARALANGDLRGGLGADRRIWAGVTGGELPFFGNVEGKSGPTVGANANLNIPNVLGLPDFTAAPGQWNATQGGFRAVPNWKPPSKSTATGGGASGGGSARAMPNFAEDDLRALQAVVEATTRANEEFDRLAATLAGPLAEAEFQHKQNLEEIDALAKEAGKSDQERLDLRDAEIARYQEETEAIEAQLDPARDLIDQKRFELELMGMSEAERRTAIDLRHAEGKATAEQAAEIRALNDAMEAEAEKIGALDDHRALFEDLLVDLPKRGKDAWKDFLDDWGQMMTRMAARKLIEQVFGGYGTNGSGSSGGDLLGGLIGAFLGGGTSSSGPFAGESAGSVVDLFSGSGFGFATGGYTGVGGRNQVAGIAHKGEVVWSQDDVARAGGVGAVERMRRGGSRGGGLVIHQHFDQRVSKQTIGQAARESGRTARREMSRTGP